MRIRLVLVEVQAEGLAPAEVGELVRGLLAPRELTVTAPEGLASSRDARRARKPAGGSKPWGHRNDQT
jgi:uncharacterized protein involved in propanediol utilization